MFVLFIYDIIILLYTFSVCNKTYTNGWEICIVFFAPV